MARKRERIDPDTRLPECPERAVGMDLALPISDRLDTLVELAEQEGENTSRKEVVAALILAASELGEELGSVLRTYRKARALDALVQQPTNAEILEFARPRPGRRPRGA